VAIYYKDGNCKTIPSGFLTCIRLNPELNTSVNYIAACLRYKEDSIISRSKTAKNTSNKKSKIQLKLSDIYNIEIPIASNKVQKGIDRLSSEATELLKQSIEKTKEIEGIVKKNS
jgi:nitrate reductase NapAB chaperone NapD